MKRQVFLASAYAEKGDSTAALQALIDEAGKVGGQVRFTPGLYESSTLYMRSNVSLYFDMGAILRGVDDYTAYSNTFPIDGNPFLNEVTGAPRWHDALIYAQDLENVSIEGHGLLDGNYVINPDGEQQFRGPMIVLFNKCKNVRISGISLVRASNYNIFFDSCEDILVDRVRASEGQDALRVMRCSRLEVKDCDFRTGDDCVSGSLNYDFYIHDCKFNTPGGNVLLFGCKNLHLKNCKVWSQGESPAIFKDDKRYSNGWTALNMLHDIHKPEYLMSDNWLIEDCVFENIEMVFCHDTSLFYTKGNNGKVTLRNITAKNFVYPITILGVENSDFELNIEGGHFIRSSLDKREDKSFIRAENFKKISITDATLEGVSDDPLHFKNGGEVQIRNLSLVKKLEEADFEAINKTDITNDPVKTDADFFVYDDVDSIYVPKEQDESFIGAKKFI